MLRIFVPQDGCTLRVAHSGGLVEAIDDQGVRGILAHLPEHPDERMRASSRGSCLVLPSGVAPLVTQVLEPPSVMDVSQVYVGEAYVKGGGDNRLCGQCGSRRKQLIAELDDLPVPI